MSLDKPPSPLQSGVFFGKTVQHRLVAGLTFTENSYAPGLKLPAHAHEHAYFCLVLDGSYTEVVNGRARTCSPCSLLYHPPRELHSDTFHRKGGRCLSVELDQLWLERARQQSTAFGGPAEFPGSRLRPLAVRLCHELRIMDSASPLSIEGLFLEILAEASRWQFSTSSRSLPRWAETAREMLHDRFAERLSLTAIAQSVGVHPMHLAREFRRHYGCSVGEYVRKLRIDFACIELVRTRAALIEIALSCGFFDQSHFTRVLN